MAKGYPDYWVQAQAGLPLPGVDQLEWGLSNSLPVAGGATVALIDSVGIAGRVYYIVGGIISSDFPMIQRYQEWIDLAVYPWQYFDTRGHFHYNPSALLRLTGVQRYRFWVNNLDVIAHTFSVQLTGFYTDIIPGSPLVLAPVGVGLAIPGSGV